MSHEIKPRDKAPPDIREFYLGEIVPVRRQCLDQIKCRAWILIMAQN